jgi:hypothetical protein
MASLYDTIMLDHFAYRETHDTALTRCFIGPPGSGKSTAPTLAAEALGVPCYTISLLATDPMEVRGYDTPGTDGELIARVASHWKNRTPYSIVVFEELDKAYLQQLHSVIDLMTSRKVGDYTLEPLHFIAVANTAEFASSAVLDRLLITPVPDPRNNQRVADEIRHRIIEYSGLHPEMFDSPELADLLTEEVFPPYAVLDSLKSKSRAGTVKQGLSERRVIALLRGRVVSNTRIKKLIDANNARCENQDEYQHYMVYNHTSARIADHMNWNKLLSGRSDWTDVQEQVIKVNGHLSAYLLNQPEGAEDEDE